MRHGCKKISYFISSWKHNLPPPPQPVSAVLEDIDEKEDRTEAVVQNRDGWGEKRTQYGSVFNMCVCWLQQYRKDFSLQSLHLLPPTFLPLSAPPTLTLLFTVFSCQNTTWTTVSGLFIMIQWGAIVLSACCKNQQSFVVSQKPFLKSRTNKPCC